MKKTTIFLALMVSLNSYADSYYFNHGKKVLLTKAYEKRVVKDTNVDYYLTKSGRKVGVTKEIILKCKDKMKCLNNVEKYNFQKITQLSEQLFVVTIDKDEDIFEVSQKLYLDEQIKFAHPNFIKPRKMR